MKTLKLIAAFMLLATASGSTALAQEGRGFRLAGGFERFSPRGGAAQTRLSGETLAPDSLGALDPTFGTGGKVITDMKDDNFTRQMRIQPDGKIVALGWSRNADFDLLSTYLIRYNADGSVDTTFGTNGIVRRSNLLPAPEEDFEDGFVFLPDGKILVAGAVTQPNIAADFGISRLNPDGSRDTTWGVNGVLKVTPLGTAESYAHEIYVLPDGKILVFGAAYDENENIWKLAVVRLNPNGTVDTTFGTNGTFRLQLPNNTAFFRVAEIVPQPDGKILFLVPLGAGTVVGRMNQNGGLDTSFGANGFIGSGSGEFINVKGIHRQADGKILIVTNNGSISKVTRYGADGAADASFGAGGIASVPSAGGVSYRFRAVIVEPSGKIVLGGSLDQETTSIFGLARLNSNGAIDTSFGTNGIVRATLRGVDDYLTYLALQPDGKLVALGDVAVTTSEPYDIGLARFSLNAPAPSPFFDFDGDNRADISVFRSGVWYRVNSADNSFSGTQWGIASDKLVPADYDGDRRSDLAVFRNGAWYLLNSQNNAFRAVPFGQAGDAPIPGDYDGDGRADVAVFRSGIWYIQNSSNNSFRAEQFGQANDKPLNGDFDADGKQDLAVFRGGAWYVNRSTAGFFAAQFGLAADKPVAADYDGDGKTDLAVYRDGVWYISNSSNGQFRAAPFGIASDRPAPADFDGDGRADLTVFRNGNWFISNSTNNAFRAVQFGQTGDTPVEAAYQP